MCSAQVAGAHQEFIHDLSAGKAESLFEQLYPLFFCFGMMMLQPLFKGTEFFLQRQDGLCIFDGSIDLKTVPDDACIL